MNLLKKKCSAFFLPTPWGWCERSEHDNPTHGVGVNEVNMITL